MQTLKVITWNCNMAFRKKASHILVHQPDILVVPECEHPDKLKFGESLPVPTDCFWFGSNPNKGLGIFSYSGLRMKLLDIHNPDYKMILPLAITGGSVDFTLFAIWANNPGDPRNQYVGQVWKAMHSYEPLLKSKKTMLVGDFNSNTIWDKPRRVANHTAVVDFLRKKKIYSVYHKFFKQKQGAEDQGTLFMYRHKEKPYHIDYCFASVDFVKKISSIEIGAHERWSAFSDHTPLIVTFNLGRKPAAS